jgi:hypothetical protein
VALERKEILSVKGREVGEGFMQPAMADKSLTFSAQKA